jgi:hypothetical protein
MSLDWLVPAIPISPFRKLEGRMDSWKAEEIAKQKTNSHLADLVISSIEIGLKRKTGEIKTKAERFTFKEKQEYQERLIYLRNKVKEQDQLKKDAIKNYRKALLAYEAKDDDVILWEEEKRNELTKHRRLNRRNGK